MKNLIIVIVACLFLAGCNLKEPRSMRPQESDIIEQLAQFDTTGKYRCNVVERGDYLYFINSEGRIDAVTFTKVQSQQQAGDDFLFGFLIGAFVCLTICVVLE